MLLSPSVSPGYPLEESLKHVSGALHVFHSDRDTLFLKWRTSTFGTYNNVKSAAAGNCGFAPYPALPPDLAAKLVQHAYDPRWESLGNDGGHMGSAAHDFVRAVVVPLLNSNTVNAPLPPAHAGGADHPSERLAPVGQR